MILASRLRPTLAGALLALTTAAGAAPAVTFDTTPRPGQHQRQLIDMQMTMSQRVEADADATEAQHAEVARMNEGAARMGPIKMIMQLEQSVAVGQPDADGWLPLDVRSATRGGQVEVAGRTQVLPADQFPKVGIAARFNPRDFSYEIQQVQGSDALQDAGRAQANGTVSEALQLFKALAARPMQVGDSVEVPLNMALPMNVPGASSQMNSTVRYTLARVERGVAHFDLDMDLNIAADVPLPAPQASAASATDGAATADAAPASQGVMQMHAGGSGKGKASLRLADRLPLTSQLDMDMEMNMQAPGKGRMIMTMTISMQSKGESLSPRGAAKAATKKAR